MNNYMLLNEILSHRMIIVCSYSHGHSLELNTGKKMKKKKKNEKAMGIVEAVSCKPIVSVAPSYNW